MIALKQAEMAAWDLHHYSELGGMVVDGWITQILLLMLTSNENRFELGKIRS